MPSAAQVRFDETLDRASNLLNRKIDRTAAELAREDAEQMMAERERVRNDSYRRHEIGAKYQPAFEAFGTQVPAPIDDETPGQFRFRLYESLRTKLPNDHDLAAVRADSLPAGPARTNFEAMMIEAATREGLTPSLASLPDTGEVRRSRTDPETGAKATEFYSRESFVKGLGRPGRLVHRILNPKSGHVLMGPPLSRYEVSGGHYGA